MTLRATSRLLLMLITSCGAISGPGNEFTDPERTAPGTPLVLVDVRLVPMTAEAVTVPRTVVIRDGLVEAIGGTELPRPDGAVVIEGGGRYLMPALMDMHVHLRTVDLPAYLASGIATVRNMWGWPELLELKGRVDRGEVEGPRIISASNGLDDEPVQWPYTRVVSSPADADGAVQEMASAGWTYLKVYTRLKRDTFLAIMNAARTAGITPVGHVPLAVPVEEAIAEGLRTIEHLTGYERRVSRSGRGGSWAWLDADPSRYPALVELSRSAGVWNCPTLDIYRAFTSQHSAADLAIIRAERRRFVRALSQGGAGLLAGTDAGFDVIAPGTSIHDELAELVAAGLSPYQALRAATADAGLFLGLAPLGTVTVGAPADFLLVRHNPLAGLGRLPEFDGMIQRGRWVRRG